MKITYSIRATRGIDSFDVVKLEQCGLTPRLARLVRDGVRDGKADDLTKVKGIGPAAIKKLKKHGLFKFDGTLALVAKNSEGEHKVVRLFDSMRMASKLYKSYTSQKKNIRWETLPSQYGPGDTFDGETEIRVSNQLCTTKPEATHSDIKSEQVVKDWDLLACSPVGDELTPVHDTPKSWVRGPVRKKIAAEPEMLNAMLFVSDMVMVFSNEPRVNEEGGRSLDLKKMFRFSPVLDKKGKQRIAREKCDPETGEVLFEEGPMNEIHFSFNYFNWAAYLPEEYHDFIGDVDWSELDKYLPGSSFGTNEYLMSRWGTVTEDEDGKLVVKPCTYLCDTTLFDTLRMLSDVSSMSGRFDHSEEDGFSTDWNATCNSWRDAESNVYDDGRDENATQEAHDSVSFVRSSCWTDKANFMLMCHEAYHSSEYTKIVKLSSNYLPMVEEFEECLKLKALALVSANKKEVDRLNEKIKVLEKGKVLEEGKDKEPGLETMTEELQALRDSTDYGLVSMAQTWEDSFEPELRDRGEDPEVYIKSTKSSLETCNTEIYMTALMQENEEISGTQAEQVAKAALQVLDDECRTMQQLDFWTNEAVVKLQKLDWLDKRFRQSQAITDIFSSEAHETKTVLVRGVEHVTPATEPLSAREKRKLQHEEWTKTQNFAFTS
jgi:hypothetical protein